MPSLMRTERPAFPPTPAHSLTGDDLQEETREAACSGMCRALAQKMTYYIRGDQASEGTKKVLLCCYEHAQPSMCSTELLPWFLPKGRCAVLLFFFLNSRAVWNPFLECQTYYDKSQILQANPNLAGLRAGCYAIRELVPVPL